MSNSDWTNNPVWNQINPHKKQFITNFLKQADQLTPIQALPFFMDLQKQMQEKNLTFTKQEVSLIMEAISTQQLSPQEQLAYQTIKQML
ncbi:putative uncharacterized protein [Clostridium sp. CAG:411]|jgi:hypothetical protein|nr:putative uncharacterized protein [Clostridium sp. CAG:411]